MRAIFAAVLASAVSCCAFGQTYNIKTFAGNGTPGFIGDNGPAISAQFNGPSGVAVDAKGNLYIADSNNYRVREVRGGVVTTVAGSGVQGYSGDAGPATSAQLSLPNGVAVDSEGSLYVADGIVIRSVSDGVINTFAGGCYYERIGLDPLAPDWLLVCLGDAPRTPQNVLNPLMGVAVDASGDLYTAEIGSNLVLEVSNGTISTAADGLNAPSGVAVDSAGNLFIADTGNNLVRKVSKGAMTTVAGNGTPGYGGDGGAATSAELNGPVSIALDAVGNLYIADTGNNRIRKVTNGVITTIAGNGTAGYGGDGGPAASAELNGPMGVAVDAAGNVYVSDSGNDCIRLLTPLPPVPQINAGGVVNLASYTAPVAAGSIAAVVGSFSVNTAADTDVPLDLSLQNLSFQFGSGTTAPLFMVSGEQANVQVPWELAGQLTATIAATLAGQTGAAQTVKLAAFAPGIFAVNGQGSGQGAILDASYNLVNASNPATAGSTIVLIYCTGLGAVSNQPATGAAAPDAPLAWTTTMPTVTIGGAPATVLYSGLAPGFVGLYQVNALVPAGASSGAAVPVTISIGGVGSNTVTMAVR